VGAAEREPAEPGTPADGAREIYRHLLPRLVAAGSCDPAYAAAALESPFLHARPWRSVWNPNRFRIRFNVSVPEFFKTFSSVVETLGSEDERSKNRGKRNRCDGGRDF
jgi:hypothetical protein